jgi:hypothetical protein
MTDDPIRKLPDGEELVLADEEPGAPEAGAEDPRATNVERRHRALAARSPELRPPFAGPAPPPRAAP